MLLVLEYETSKVISTPVIKELPRAEVGKRALIAVAHTMLIAIYHILKEKVPYHDLERTTTPLSIKKR